jgi:hypothetical protein
MKTKFIRTLSSILILTTINITNIKPVFASELNKEIIVSEEYAKEQKEKSPRYGENEKITVVDTDYKYVTVKPNGQPPGGYNYPSGGAVFVNTSMGSSQSFSVGVAWGIVNFSVSVGQASVSPSIGGNIVNIPAGNNFYTIGITKKMKIEKHKVDVYQYNDYKYTYYTSVASVYSESFPLTKVN